jgi:hypothetical protein
VVISTNQGSAIAVISEPSVETASAAISPVSCLRLAAVVGFVTAPTGPSADASRGSAGLAAPAILDVCQRRHTERVATAVARAGYRRRP